MTPGMAMYFSQSSQPTERPLKPTVAMFRVESPVSRMVEVAVVATKTERPSEAASALFILAF